MTTTPTTEVAVVDPVFSDVEQYALAAFLAGYRGLTRDAYALDLRQFIAWCQEHNVRLFAARRADIECFARDIEARRRARATVARRLCTVAGFYRYVEREALLERSPAAHVRRPRLDYESHATGLDRNEGALLVAAGLASAREHTLVSLLAINGLRVSEALGADIEALGIELGHRALTVLRKGGKVVTIPFAPRTARAIDLAIGERAEGPIFVGTNGERLDRHAAWRIVRRLARKAGINKPVGPHTLRHAFITAASFDAGVPLRDVQERQVTPTPGRPCATTGCGFPSTGTPRTSWRRSSPEPPDRGNGPQAKRPSGGCGGHAPGSICRAGTATRPVDLGGSASTSVSSGGPDQDGWLRTSLASPGRGRGRHARYLPQADPLPGRAPSPETTLSGSLTSAGGPLLRTSGRGSCLLPPKS
jgi:site-specific recombinase XerD